METGPAPARIMVRFTTEEEYRLVATEDVFVDVTGFGRSEPEFLLAVDGRATDIALSREAYLLGRTTLEEFDHELDIILGLKK